MTDIPLDEILAALDLVVFEQLPEGVFRRVGSAPLPSWFSRLLVEGESGEVPALPFLEHFLTDAERFWRDGSEQRLRSDAVTVNDVSGGELAIAASAVTVGDRRLLIIEVPYDLEERRRALQRAREHVLEHEGHLRRTGALLSPVDAARQLAQRLATSGLTPEQRELADGISEQLADLSASVEALAPLPKGVSRRRRR